MLWLKCTICLLQNHHLLHGSHSDNAAPGASPEMAEDRRPAHKAE